MAYFDAASAEPVSPAAREALLAALDDGWADPVRLHREGRRASLLLDQARERVAGGLPPPADEIAVTNPRPKGGEPAGPRPRRAPPSTTPAPPPLPGRALRHPRALH